MKRIVCLCSLLLLCLPATAQANPLAPLARFQAALTKGMNAVIKGTALAKAFKPMAAKARPGLAETLKAAGGVSAQVVAMELELVFYSGTTASYYLRTEVNPAKRGPAFVSFAGRPVEGGKLYVTAHSFASYRGHAAPLAAAAAALAKAVAGPGCAKLPVATAADFSFMPPGKLTERNTKGLERTRSGLASQCATLSALKPSRVELRVDDVAFAVLGADGKLVGVIKTGLELDKSGALAIEIGRFKEMPK